MRTTIIDGITYNLVPVEESKSETFHVAKKGMTWESAMHYAEVKNMRLLRSDELHALVRDALLPFMKGVAWSSSSVSDDTSRAWGVYLGNGYTDYGTKSNTYRVVCVAKDFDLATFLKEKSK